MKTKILVKVTAAFLVLSSIYTFAGAENDMQGEQLNSQSEEMAGAQQVEEETQTQEELSEFQKFQEEIEDVTSGSSTSIYVDDDIDIEETIEVFGKVTLNTMGNITLRKGSFSGSIFKINSGATLTLNCDIGEFELSGDDGGSGPLVENLGTFKIRNGVILRGNENAENGGAVYNSGTFEMSGGEIVNCSAEYGGAVFNTGIFNMLDGKISNNKATNGGGIFNASNGKFSMSGGEISNNSGTMGGAIYNVGEFNMSGPAYIPYGDNNDVMLANTHINITGALTNSSAPMATVRLSETAPGSVIAKALSGTTIGEGNIACLDSEYDLFEYNNSLVLCNTTNSVCPSTPEYFGKTISVKLHLSQTPGTVVGKIFDSTGNAVSKSGATFTTFSEAETNTSTTQDILDIGDSNSCSGGATAYLYKTTISTVPTGQCTLKLFDVKNNLIIGNIKFTVDQTAPQISNSKVTNATSTGTNTYKYSETPTVKFYYEDEESIIKTVSLTRPTNGAKLQESDLGSDSNGDYVSYKIQEPGTYTFAIIDIAGNKNEIKYTFTKDATTTTKTSTTATTSTTNATTSNITGPVKIKLITTKEPAGKTVASVAKNAKISLADYLDATFFSAGTNKIEIISEEGGTVTLTAADIIQKAKEQTASSTTATTNATSDATVAVNFIKQYTNFSLETKFEDDDDELQKIRAQNKTYLGSDEDIAMLSFVTKQALPCNKATVSIVADSVAAARVLNLPVDVYKANSSGTISNLVSSSNMARGVINFEITDTNSSYVMKKVSVSAKQSNNTYKKCAIDGLNVEVQKLKELASEDGVKNVVINGDYFIWNITAKEAKKISRTGKWDLDIKIISPTDTKSKYKLDSSKNVILDFATKGSNGCKATIYVRVADSLKNKKGVTVYKLNQNGKLTAIAKNKTVSKNGVILLTSIKST